MTIEGTQPTHQGSTEQQIVALHLGNEIYGVDIAIIHTVITPQDITAVPKTPKYIKGVMNLRGRILPVIDLRTRFDLPALTDEEQKTSRIVIVDTEGLTAGLIVDAVSEVLTLNGDEIEPPSGLLSSKDSEFITGIGRIRRGSEKDGKGEQLILLLDVAKALLSSAGDVAKLKKLQSAA